MTTSPITTVAIAASTALLAAAAYHQGKRAARLESESLLRRHSSSDGVCSADVSSKKVVRGSYTSGVEMNDYTRDGSSQTETSSPKLGFSFMTKLMLNHMKGAAAAAPVQQKMLLEGCSTVSSEEVVVSQDKIDDEADQCNSNDKVKTTDGAALKKTESTNEFDMLPIYPIGTLHSIYRLCVGTPRQVSEKFDAHKSCKLRVIIVINFYFTLTTHLGNASTALSRNHHLPRTTCLSRLYIRTTTLFTRICSVCFSFE
jgi:hypothetical protein